MNLTEYNKIKIGDKIKYIGGGWKFTGIVESKEKTNSIRFKNMRQLEGSANITRRIGLAWRNIENMQLIWGENFQKEKETFLSKNGHKIEVSCIKKDK